MSVLLDGLGKETNAECVRVGAWAVLGKATGASLVDNGTSDPVSLQDLVGVDMAILKPDLATVDPVTGLIRPQAGTAMRLADGTITPVPDEWFLHPQTGKLLPIEGHVSYDPISSRLIFTADSASGSYLTTMKQDMKQDMLAALHISPLKRFKMMRVSCYLQLVVPL